MKKQYTTPEMKLVNVNPTELICASVGFDGGGDPITDMHAKEFGVSFDDDFGISFDDDFDGLIMDE